MTGGLGLVPQTAATTAASTPALTISSSSNPTVNGSAVATSGDAAKADAQGLQMGETYRTVALAGDCISQHVASHSNVSLSDSLVRLTNCLC